MLLVVAFIGVLSALMALQLERGKEYAVLRALGLTRRQIGGLIGGESLLMGLLAAVVALPTGGLMAWVLIQSVQRRAFGWTMPFEPDPGLLMQSVAIGLLAACGGTDGGDGVDATNDNQRSAFQGLEAEAPIAEQRPVGVGLVGMEELHPGDRGLDGIMHL